MAPEILLYKDYNKSVDMWSVGILMYMLISGGHHPFYKSGMNLKEYCDLLQKSPDVQYDDAKFSKLSKDLINKLLNFETVKRYSVYQAVKHPWITRCNESSIPETFDEVFKNLEIEERLRQTMKLCFFCSIIKSKKEKQEKQTEDGYFKLLNKVTSAIEKWRKTKRKTDFINDEDFIERQGSPNKFDTTSNFSQAMEDYDTYHIVHNNSSVSSPRGLSPNGSSMNDASPKSECGLNILRPIKMASFNNSDHEDDGINRMASEITENQISKNSDNTMDTTKRGNTEFKNSHRSAATKVSPTKPRLQDSSKKLVRNKKGRVKSPGKKSKLRVNVPRDTQGKVNMAINNELNFSIIDEHVMAEKLQIPNAGSKLSRSYLSSTKNQDEVNTFDGVHGHSTFKNQKALSNQYLQNAVNLNDYRDHKHKSGKISRPVL